MLFLYIISLLYLAQLVSSRYLTESEAMNKVIEDILLKAEQKNAEPIKFIWTDRVRADDQLSTQHFIKTRKTDKNENIFDLHVEPFLRNKPKLNGPSMTLQEILSQINKIQAQTDRNSFGLKYYRTTKDDAPHTTVSRAKHSSKTRTRHRNKTRSMASQQKDSNRIDQISSSASTTKYNVRSFKPLHNDAFYLKRIPVGVTERITNLQKDAVSSTFKTAPVVEVSLSQGMVQTTVPEVEIDQQQVIEISNANSGFELRPSASMFTIHQYDTTTEINNDENKFKMSHVDYVYTPAQSVLTAKHWGSLHSMEYLLNSVPNYDKTESLENIMKNIAQQISSVGGMKTTESQYKMTQKSLDELDAEIRRKPSEHNIYDTTSKMKTRRSMSPSSDVPYPDFSLRSTSTYSTLPTTDSTAEHSKSTFSSLISTDLISSSYSSLQSTDLTLTHPTCTHSSLKSSKDSTFEVSKHSKSTERNFLSSIITLKPSTSTNSNNSSPEFISADSTPSDLTSKYSEGTNDKNTSSDLYLLVDHKDNLLKGYLTIDSNADKTQHTDDILVSPAPTQIINKLTDDVVSDTTLAFNNKDTADLYKEIMQLYENIKPPIEEKKKQPLHKKITNSMSWERIKKIFGHDRVCNCNCKENKTMCKVCAASDAVIRELIFEFNNLAEYMQRHCTEIQTFFWMNPSGGKKLRDVVHKMDKAMQDYYKRAKGKCAGRTCKTFATYLDKRQEIKRKIDFKYIENLLEELNNQTDNFTKIK